MPADGKVEGEEMQESPCLDPKELVCSWADKLCTPLQKLADSSAFECQMCIINNMS